MKIGIIGRGNVGSKLAVLFKDASHDVVIGSRSAPVQPLGVAEHGDVVILAFHYQAVADSLPSLAGALVGKIVIDATNPLNADWSPLELPNSSAAEEIAKLLPRSKVVKAFNTIYADVMDRKFAPDGNKITTFVASEHDDAIQTVTGLAQDCGFDATPINKLKAARYLEGMAHLNIELAVGQGGGTKAVFQYLRWETVEEKDE